ncbi:MAG: trypsin-like serine protease [Alteromonadaceae bacterium]|nr:trypsin-like serine protease [Alteromonadaceae bacterium]
MKVPYVVVGLAALLLSMVAQAIVIRHDVSDEKYIALGKKYSSSVAYVGGCAATLVDMHWILTAAHCLQDHRNVPFLVRVQDNHYRVARVVIHPEFSSENDEIHDIALVKLKDPVRNGIPVKLYSQRDETGMSVVFIGKGTFGNGQDGLIRDDGKQRGATNTVDDVTEQVIAFTFNAPPDTTELEGISSRGDSGGPAFVSASNRLYVIGVSSYQMSHGHREGNYGVGEYYTRVSSYRPWLEQVIENASTPAIAGHAIIDALLDNDLSAFGEHLADPNIQQPDVLTEVFYQIIMQNKPEFAAALVKADIDFMTVRINQQSPFEFALRQGRTDIVDVFMAHTRTVPVKHDATSRVLPYYVAYYRNSANLLEGVTQLLAQGANINAVTSAGDSALIITGWSTDNLALIKLLVQAGANIDQPNNNGDTPLMDAAYLGKIAHLDYLLTQGADTFLTNKRGHTALDLARRANHSDAVKRLSSN